MLIIEKKTEKIVGRMEMNSPQLKEYNKDDYDFELEPYEKKMHSNYKGTNVSLTNRDALAMLQIKTAFELGVKSTNIKFENGTVMEMKAEDFKDFAIWFAIERNKFFI